MNISFYSTPYSKSVIAVFLICTCLSLTFSASALINSHNEPENTNNSIINNADQVDIYTVNKDAQTATETKSKKTDLHTQKRELSSFFKLGIAINIAMILTFAYWFIGQWRQQK